MVGATGLGTFANRGYECVEPMKRHATRHLRDAPLVRGRGQGIYLPKKKKEKTDQKETEMIAYDVGDGFGRFPMTQERQRPSCEKSGTRRRRCCPLQEGREWRLPATLQSRQCSTALREWA